MGGRGGYIGFQNKNGKSNIKRTDTYDQDTETKNQTNIVKKLKNRNIIVMTSTDNIPYEILTPNLKQLDKIVSTDREYANFLKNNKLCIRTESFSDNNVQACFSCYIDEFKKPQIIFNKNFTKQNAEEINKTTKDQIKKKFWTKSDDNQLINHTLTHEVGHYVQRMMTEKIAKENNEIEVRSRNPLAYDKKIAEKMFSDIDKICYSEYGEHIKTSIYGESSEFEFFAETFCELKTTRNPSNAAKALDIYLKRSN